ncbi:MAG: hypothetical protein MUO54_01685 [Anaerolineales bacterium]|nr:hypothetical protein [Anaerolineales bacterium]
MNNIKNLPKVVSIVSIILGSIDLVRGVMHTILLNFAASNIAGLDLSSTQASDLLQLMGAFGISNYITGIALILVGWKARDLAWIMLGVIPAVYLIGGLAIRLYSAGSTETQAAWGCIPMMAVYLAVSSITFIYGLWKSRS